MWFTRSSTPDARPGGSEERDGDLTVICIMVQDYNVRNPSSKFHKVRKVRIILTHNFTTVI